MSKAHRLKTRTPKALQSVSLNFLLGCSEGALSDCELARLDEVANLRAELHVTLDKMLEQMAQAAVAGWFRATDRHVIKQAVESLESSPDKGIDEILGWAKEQIRNQGRSKEEIGVPPPSLPPGAAHLAAAVRYQQRNIAEGKCSVCPKPLDPSSVYYCTKHLDAARIKSARKRSVKGEPGSADYLYGEITESKHGRQPGTLQSLALSREKKTRALLAELGVPAESNPAVGLKAAIEALEKVMPQSKRDAMTQAQLFEKAGVVTKTTGQKALQQLLFTGEIRRIGKGGPLHAPYRYFRGSVFGKLLDEAL